MSTDTETTPVIRVTNIFSLFAEMSRLTALTPKSMEKRMLKMTNEVGELAGAVDIAAGNAGTAYRNVENPIQDVLSEAVDVGCVLGSFIIQLMNEHNISAAEVFAMFDKKMAKWGAVLEHDETV